jgi:hypothetical protein
LWDDFQAIPEAAEFVDKQELRCAAAAGKDDAYRTWMNARAIILGYWLRRGLPGAAAFTTVDRVHGSFGYAN